MCVEPLRSHSGLGLVSAGISGESAVYNSPASIFSFSVRTICTSRSALAARARDVASITPTRIWEHDGDTESLHGGVKCNADAQVSGPKNDSRKKKSLRARRLEARSIETWRRRARYKPYHEFARGTMGSCSALVSMSFSGSSPCIDCKRLEQRTTSTVLLRAYAPAHSLRYHEQKRTW